MINEELIAAFLDGNTTPAETIRIVKAMQTDKRLSRLIFNCYMVDEDQANETSKRKRKGKVVEMPSHKREESGYIAAKNEANNCEILCENYILKAKGMMIESDELIEEARKKGWFKDAGTKLNDFGKLLESKGLAVERKHQALFEELKKALDNQKHVLVAVDGGELIGDIPFERFEDQCIGKIPDHAVVVTAYNETEQTISLYDPAIGNQKTCVYSYERFLDAWDDSNNYIIIAD